MSGKCARAARSALRPERVGTLRSPANRARQAANKPRRRSGDQFDWPRSNHDAAKRAICSTTRCDHGRSAPSGRCASAKSDSSGNLRMVGPSSCIAPASASTAASVGAWSSPAASASAAARCSRPTCRARQSSRTTLRGGSKRAPAVAANSAATCSKRRSTQPWAGLTAIRRSSGQAGAIPAVARSMARSETRRRGVASAMAWCIMIRSARAARRRGRARMRRCRGMATGAKSAAQCG